MEKFYCKKTIGGYITVPAAPKNHPLLSRIHRDDGTGRIHRRLPWESLEEGLRRIRSVAYRLGMTVQVCGDWRHQPTVILREKPESVEPEPILPFDGNMGDGAHWGVTDIYPDLAVKLRGAIESGLPSDTGWYSVKKEIESARVRRKQTRGPIEVEVSRCMDEAHDLVDTAFWKAAGGNAYCASGYDALEKHGLSEDEIYAVIDEVADRMELGEDNCERSGELLHWKSGYDRVMSALDRCSDTAGETLESWFDLTVSVCRDRLKDLRKEMSASCETCKHFHRAIPESRMCPVDPAECGHPRHFALLSANRHFPFRNGCKFWESRFQQPAGDDENDSLAA